MNNCPHCEAEIEPGFEVCWKCSYSLAEQKVIELPVPGQHHLTATIQCLRCHVPMVFAGTRKIHDRIHWTTLGNLVELLSNMDSFDLYLCPRCDKVEFFLSSPPGAEPTGE